MISGVCKALGGTTITGTTEVLEANPNCVCASGLQATFCPYGHMLECHYPKTCAEADCSHYQRQRTLESEVND